jgi:hypothetical protein
VADGCRDDEPELAELGDLSSLLLEGEDMVERVAKAHHATWGLGTADSWGLDQRTGVITWALSGQDRDRVGADPRFAQRDGGFLALGLGEPEHPARAERGLPRPSGPGRPSTVTSA